MDNTNIEISEQVVGSKVDKELPKLTKIMPPTTELTINTDNQKRFEETKARLIKREIETIRSIDDAKALGRSPSTLALYEKAAAEIKATISFLRPQNSEDVQYRNEVANDFSNLVKQNAPEGIPFRFHGTPIYRAKQIIATGGLFSSVDRLGVGTSYDAEEQVSVTTAETVDYTITNYTGLREQDYQVPAGCVFVLLPKSSQDAASADSMLMSNVDFRANPQQLFKILTTPEMLEEVQTWSEQSGIDRRKVTDFMTFPDELRGIKEAISQGKTSAQDYVPYNLALQHTSS